MPTEPGRPADPIADRTIVSHRVLHADPATIWRAWVEPERLARWWGPAGFTNTFEVFEPVPGGRWRFVMHGPNGTDYPNESRFLELAPGERIVFDHIVAPLFRMTVTLTPAPGGTRIEWRMTFEDAATCAKVKAIVGGANEENFDRLEAELATMR